MNAPIPYPKFQRGYGFFVTCPRCGKRIPGDTSTSAASSYEEHYAREHPANAPAVRHTLNYDWIPIEYAWELSMLFHEECGHTELWEICDQGCEALASRAINILFGRESA